MFFGLLKLGNSLVSYSNLCLKSGKMTRFKLLSSPYLVMAKLIRHVMRFESWIILGKKVSENQLLPIESKKIG